MVSPKLENEKWCEILKNQAVDRNQKSVTTWSKYKSDLGETKSLLSLIPKKIKHDVMVPIGSKALMYGKIVHTNEFLVNLGETWFVNRSAAQAIEICDRRIKTCDEMLKKLETEMQLIVNKSTLPAQYEAFGSEEHPEIIEYVTEEEDEEWKRQHKIKEKKYRQQLAELRNQEKKKIETEEDLWKHLDELELQEELEDELNRLNAECSSEEDINEKNLESSSTCKELDKDLNMNKQDNQKISENDKTVNEKKVKKQVTLSLSDDLSDDEPLRLEIKHSDVEPAPSNPNSEKIISPSDIYNNYKKSQNTTIKSILKKNTCVSNESKSQLTHNIVVDEYALENHLESEVTTTPTSFVVKDVVERNLSDINSTQMANLNEKKISKFKTKRIKNM